MSPVGPSVETRRRLGAGRAPRSPTDIPPPRYRIVERGRRLEVIDTHAERRDAQPPTGSMLAVRIPLRTSRLRDGGMDTKLVLGWTALVAVAMIGVVTFVTMGFGAVAALGVLGAGLYRKHKPALDRWLAALE